MDATETEFMEAEGHTYRISIHPDEDAPNPLNNWSEMGTILSLNRRHHNFDPAGIEAAIETNPDAVRLSYFEHGRCLWSVAGEQPASCRCPWDAVPFAGLWLPDSEILVSAARYGGRTRRIFMRTRANQACAAYSQWCNGEIYGYTVERMAACPALSVEQAEMIDACWGIFGRRECLDEARASVTGHASLSAIESNFTIM